MPIAQREALAETVPQRVYQAVLSENDSLVIKCQELMHEKHNLLRLVDDMAEQAGRVPETASGLGDGWLVLICSLIICAEFWVRALPLAVRVWKWLF